ncbi:hypothetical protein [Marinobacter salsuginis]|uniref:hypothetical protein n=1 Tax=Marinobacter salsuginis TaxID=418719 RepID=UPI001D181D54|nr:hypothetical protein [Marinobacter salsuginis]
MMSKLLLILGLATVIALAATVSSRPMLIEERLIQIQAEDTLTGFPRIESEPLEVQAALLDMADDELLLLKARAAYLRYPEMTREILPIYGPEPEFRDILRLYGENVLPPIHYFLSNPIGSIELMNDLAARYRAAVEFFSGDEKTDTDTAGQQKRPVKEKLTREERGWYAVRFIQEEGMIFWVNSC